MAVNYEIKYAVDLNKGLPRSVLMMPLVQNDIQAHVFKITVTRNGVAENVSGITAKMIRNNGTTLAMTGTASANVASVTLPQAAYAVPGRAQIVIKATVSGVTSTIAMIECGVATDTTETVVDPGSVVPDITTLLAQISRMETATTAAEGAVSMIAPEYAPPYSAGEYATHSGHLYRANTAIASGETWTAAHWTQVTGGGELKSIDQAVYNVGDRLSEVDGIATEVFELNGINGTTGLPEVNNKRIRSKDYTPIDTDHMVINLSEGYSLVFRFYDDNNQLTAVTPGGFINQRKIDVNAQTKNNGTKYKIVVKSVDEVVLEDIVPIANQIIRTEVSTNKVKEIEENRKKIDAVNESVDRKIKSALFEQGAVLADGTEVDRTTRIRTGYIPVGQNYIFSNPTAGTDTYYWIRVFDSNKSFIGNARYTGGAFVSSTDVTESTFCVIDKITDNQTFVNAGFVRIVCRKINDSADIIPDEIQAVLYKNKLIEITVGSIIENGTIRNSDGKIGYGWDDVVSRNSYVRCPRFIKVIHGGKFSVNTNIGSVNIYEYDKDLNWIRTVQYQSSIIVPDDTEYVKFRVYKSSGTITEYDDVTVTLDTENGQYTEVKNKNTTDDHISFLYQVGKERAFTTGKLKLPESYNVFGEAVPMIVFVHGSGSYPSAKAQDMAASATMVGFYDYLRDCGYAVFDCFGWSTDKLTSGSSTWGTPNNIHCYKSGIQYVLDNWNIDKDNVFVASKSLGGIVAALLSQDKTLNLKAAGLLAPELDMLQPNPFGYDRSVRVAIAEDVGFIGEWESVLDVSNDDFVKDDAYDELMKENAEILCGHIPTWNGVTLSIDEKIENSLSAIHNTTAFQFGSIPVKIWIAQDDQAVSYNQSSAYIQRVKNAGGYAELRTMPTGTGGHHSVDTDPSAPQTTNVVTRLGVTYSTIPTAFYELAKWFDGFVTK